MAKSKIDKAFEKVTENEIKSIHKIIKPKREFNILKIFKILTIVVVILAIISIFLFWKFNVIDLPTYNKYEGKSKVHLLSYCNIEKFRCKTSKLENGSIILNIKNNFNEIVSINELSFGDCANQYNVTLDKKDKVHIMVSCKNYKNMSIIYQRESGISHKSRGKVFYLLDLTKIFKIFYQY